MDEFLKKSVREIPGIDLNGLDLLIEPYKQNMCDPIVITKSVALPSKFCAPISPTTEEKENLLSKAVESITKIIDGTKNQYSQQTVFQDVCLNKYIDDINNLITKDISVTISNNIEEISKIPLYISSFWSKLVVAIHCYSLSKLSNNRKISSSILLLATDYQGVPSLYKKKINIVLSQIDKRIPIANLRPTHIDDNLDNITRLFDGHSTFSYDGTYKISFASTSSADISGIISDANNVFSTPSPIDLKNGNMNLSVNESIKAFVKFDEMVDYIISLSVDIYSLNINKLMDFDTYFDKSFAEYKDSFIKLSNAYASMDLSSIESYVRTGLSMVKVCGTANNVTDDVVGTKDTSIKDLSFNTFSSDGQPDFTSIDYWINYSKIINSVGLLPSYWTVGIVLPSPNGLIKIPTPIIWKPIFVKSTPTMLVVIFLTINGMVVSPVVWTLIQKPIADAESKFTTLFRGTNAFIKSNTGVTIINMPVVNNINVDPSLSKTLPFETDDLCSIERLSLSNPLVVAYINRFLTVAVPYMGLP